MAILNYYIHGQTIHNGKNPPIIADSIGYIDVAVTISGDEWSSLNNYIQMRLGSEVINKPLTYDSSTKTWTTDRVFDLTKGTWYVSVHGYDSVDDVAERIYTDEVRLEVKKSGMVDGDPFPDVIPSAVEMLQSGKVGYIESDDNYNYFYDDSSKGNLIGQTSKGSSSGGSVTVDSELSETSTNPVQNKAITAELNTQSEAIVRYGERITALENGGGTSISDDGDGNLTITSTSGSSVVDDGDGNITIGA